MSGGTPVGGGIVRQIHIQVLTLSGDDLEDDACSRTPRAWRWIEFMGNFLWIASAAFIVYFGDGHSNLIYILWLDDRIRRTPLYLGMVVSVLNALIFFYTSLVAPLFTLLGLFSFCLFSYALWPIWSFLTLPLLFTLFMVCMVISPYLILRMFRPQNDVVRTD